MIHSVQLNDASIVYLRELLKFAPLIEDKLQFAQPKALRAEVIKELSKIKLGKK